MTSPTPQPSPTPIFNSLPWLRLFVEGNHQLLAENFIQTFETARTADFSTVDPLRLYQINAFVSAFLFIMSHPDFQIPEKYAETFIRMNPYISSLTALSSFRTTDPFLELLRNQQNNYVKILTLYSARNSVTFDRKAIFDANTTFASLWYIQFAQVHQSGLVTKTIFDNLRAHFEFSPPALVPVLDMVHVYFGSTYVDGHCDRLIKPHINAGIQKAFPPQPLPPTKPNPRKIAVVSAVWTEGHSAPRICAGLLRALKPHYHLTFLQLGDYFKHHTSLFDEVIPVPITNGLPTLPQDAPRDFQLALFPDVGMSNESIVLANQRLAPIQVALLGHSVSTFGSLIDYFISGAAVESPDNPQQHYSEKLVLLPGMGCTHELPEYTPTHPPEPDLSNGRPVIISCPWSAHKINFPFVQNLQKLLARSSRPLLFRIFTGLNPILIKNLLPLQAELDAALGPANVDVLPALPYPTYMSLLEQSHFTLDAHHFGGCNTVSDSLFLGIPMLCWQGNKWYNRIGPEMLRRAGTPELIATNEQQFLDLAHTLIHNDPFRQSLRTRLTQTNLTPALYNDQDAPHFLTAINHLIKSHDIIRQNPNHSPITIPT